MAVEQQAVLGDKVREALTKAEAGLQRLQDPYNPPSAGAVVQTVLTLVSDLRRALDDAERPAG